MKHLEDQEQRALIEWAGFALIPNTGLRVTDFLFAIPNGGKRNIREAARFKTLGVKSGVSDLFLAYPCGSVHGYWIELKKRRNDFSSPSVANLAVTDNQKSWIKRMRSVGYMADVCYGADEAISAISMYLGMRHE